MEQNSSDGGFGLEVRSPGNRRRWAGLAVLTLPCLLYSIDLTVLNLALPSLSADLQPTGAELLWVVDIYGFVLASMLITMGRLGDRIGHRRLLLCGAVSFEAASVLAAFSQSAATLIAARAVLGVAAATFAPTTLSMIRTVFTDQHERATAIGVWISSHSVGAAVGPVVGGVLLQHFWWGSVFLIGVPVMTILLAVGPALLPESRDRKSGREDLWSSALSLMAVLATIYGVKRMAESGVGAFPVICMAAGLGIGWLFVRRQSRISSPVIDPRLFRSPAFAVALGTFTVGSFVAVGSLVFVAQYMQLVLGLEPFEAGLWSSPFFIALIISSMATPPLARRMRPGHLVIAGLSFAAVGFLLLSSVDETTAPLTLAAISCLYAFGLAPIFTLSTNFIVSSAPPEQSATASAIAETGSEFGGALGIAVLGSIVTALYRDAMIDMMPPGPLPDGVPRTLGAAIEAADRLGGELGHTILTVSRAAFLQGLKAAAIVAAVTLLVTAALAARWLPALKPTSDGADSPD
jgi:MFS transporter, DHA2 family, multidrug resistance protein